VVVGVGCCLQFATEKKECHDHDVTLNDHCPQAPSSEEASLEVLAMGVLFITTKDV
jgi:hypothetical protein